MMQMLERIGRIALPAAIERHRFVIEAMGNAMLAGKRDDPAARVVGTDNSRQVELYGWGGSVGPHSDNTGWMYFCPLQVVGRSRVSCKADTMLEVEIAAGDVVRLWDWCEHMTTDTGPVCAMFLGAFEKPCDQGAIAAFRRAAAQLARGTYYGSPRVREGFRIMLPDECLAATRELDRCEPMLIKDAERRGRWIQTCWCGEKAQRLDAYWPYQQDRNRCAQHLFEQPRAA